jgi:putative FmdB family regulatory protein
MPIYEYRCSSCGFQKEFLQKMSDPLLTVCPSCSKETFSKMVTAAGFQLKGSGWYVTDFRNNGEKASGKAGGVSAAAGGEGGAEGKPDGKSADAKPADTGAAKTDPAPAAAPASSSGASSGSTSTPAASSTPSTT